MKHHRPRPRPREVLPVRNGLVVLCLLLSLVPWPLRAHYVKLERDLVTPGMLTLGLALSGRPFSYREDGQIKGFQVEAARAIAAAHGLDLMIAQLPRGGLMAALEAGRVDLVNTLPLPSVGAGIRTIPTLQVGDHLMVLKGNPFRIKSAGDLAGRTVSVTSGTSAEAFAQSINDDLVSGGRAAMHIHSFPNQRHTHFPVSMGHAAAYFAPTVTAIAATQDPHSRTRLADGFFQPRREVGFALLPDRPDLFHAVEHAVAAMVATAKYQALLDRFGLPAELSAYR